MSIASVATALREVIVTAVGARAGYDSLPNGRPLVLPVVAVQWAQSGSAARLNLGPAAGGKWIRAAVRLSHRFEVYVLISSTQNVEAEEAAMKTAAQAMLDGLNNDATLRGTSGGDRCAGVTIESIAPYRDLVDESTVRAGIRAVLSVEEA